MLWATTWCVLGLAGLVARGQAAAVVDPGYRQVAPGLAYAHMSPALEEGPLSVHVARVTWPGRDWRLAVPLARGHVVGLSTVSAQVRALSPASGVPLLAVNGDFFVIAKGPYQGDPLGLQIDRGELVSAPRGGPAVWFDGARTPHLDEVRSGLCVRWPDGTESAMGLNERRQTNGLALYTPAFGPSTRTTGGVELVLGAVPGHPWLPLRAGLQTVGLVRQVRRAGNTALRPGRLVLSVAPEATASALPVRPGDTLELAIGTSPDMSGVDLALGGGPVLVAQGKPRVWKPPQPRHPRTAFGWNSTNLILVVVDGRQPGKSVGMTFPELADLMAGLGCAEAVNLDGGGSSTFWLTGRVRNRPSDGRERPVANSLILLRREDRASRRR